MFKHGTSILFLFVYVDNIILTGNNQHSIATYIQRLHRDFDIKDLGKLSYFLGLEVLYTPEVQMACFSLKLNMLWIFYQELVYWTANQYIFHLLFLNRLLLPATHFMIKLSIGHWLVPLNILQSIDLISLML